MNIYQKINAVRKEVEYVQKDTTVGGKYKAVTHDAVTSRARAALVEHGIVTVPSLKDSSVNLTGTETRSGTPIIRYEASYDIAFVNEEEPADRLTMTVEAHANDEGDKAPGKAISYAVKVALLKVLMLETGEDDEARVEARKAKEHLEKQADLIKQAVEEDNPELVESLWSTFTDEEKEQAWVAQTKGGFFNTAQKKFIRETGYRIVNEDVTNELREVMAESNLSDQDVVDILTEFYSDDRGEAEFGEIDSLPIGYARQAMKLITSKEAA